MYNHFGCCCWNIFGNFLNKRSRKLASVHDVRLEFELGSIVFPEGPELNANFVVNSSVVRFEVNIKLAQLKTWNQLVQHM